MASDKIPDTDAVRYGRAGFRQARDRLDAQLAESSNGTAVEIDGIQVTTAEAIVWAVALADTLRKPSGSKELAGLTFLRDRVIHGLRTRADR